MSNPTAVHLPIRLDFLGGWTDQAAWRGPAAVLHGAFGWKDAGGGPGNLYPLTVYPSGAVRSSLQGIGTGLGVSSILAAGKALASGAPDYRTAADAWEQEHGAQGGWQDALGAVEPGLKLSRPELDLCILTDGRDDHPLLDHLVLFDTGLRRESKALGDRVRASLGMPRLRAILQSAVAAAPRVLATHDAEYAARQCLNAWGNLTFLFPEMLTGLPAAPPEAWGQKYVGAGGGGYGVAFARTPAAREQVASHYRRLGLWATLPVLLPGAQVEAEPERRGAGRLRREAVTA